jgi:hypothetical protein
MNKTLLIVIAVVIAIIIIVVISKKAKGQDILKNNAPPAGNGAHPSDSTTTIIASDGSWKDDSFPLMKYSKGEKVKVIQKAINFALAKSKQKMIQEDGYYGNATDIYSKKIFNKNQWTQAEYQAIINGANYQGLV